MRIFANFKTIAAVALVVAYLCCSAPAGASDELTAVHGRMLTVYVEGVRNSVGTIGYLVFNSSRGWPDTMKEAVRGDTVLAQAGTTILKIPDLRPGNYGVLVIHDENGNMKLDRDWKGFPREQWGLSNNPRAYLSCPSYERARFTIDRNTEIRIDLK